MPPFWQFPFCSVVIYSNDVRWTYVLRVLYRAIPERSLATVEALLEQIFTQTVQVAQLLLCALEDTAVWLGRTVVTRSFLKKATIEGIVAEYDGVPEISHFDVRLALIIARAIYVSSCSTNNSGGSVSLNNISEIALPLLLSGSLVDGDSSCEQMVLEAHLSSRSVFMLVLCCVSLLLAQELRYKTYNSDSIATSVGSTLNQIIYSVSSPSAPSSSSGGWLGDARAQELLKCFLQLGAYPELPAACLALTNSWFEELRKEELRNKEEEEACDGEGGEDEQKENTVSTEARVVLGSGPELLCNMIQEVFRARQNLQPAVLMCLLKGIVSCSPGGVSARSNSVYHSQSQRTATSSSSSSSAPSSVAVAHQPESSSGSHSEVPDKLLPIHDLMQEVLARLCERHRTAVAKHVGVIQTQFGAVVHAPSLEVVQTFLCSLVSVCAESTPIFAVVHGHLLKQVQVADPHKVMSAVRVIVPLLFAVTPAQQAEVLGSLAHVLARASVFSREACVLLFRQLDLHAPPTVGTPHSTFIPRLQDIINLKLAACFSEVVVVDSKASSFGSRRKVQEILKVFNPSLCVLPQSGALTGSQVTEDIEHCVLLGWKLACMANQEESLQGAVCLAEQIIQFHGNASSSSVCIPGEIH